MNQNGPASNDCKKMRENEVYLNRVEGQLCQLHNMLDSLVVTVAPVSVERPCGIANVSAKCTDVQSPFITELYKQSATLEQIINRLQYIMESVEI